MSTEGLKDFWEDKKKWCGKLGFAIVDLELNAREAEGSGDCMCECDCSPLSATVFHSLEVSQACGSSSCSHGK